ncbi:MAG TPA: Clp protease N-terminal domain-containing protein [Acidimicrobiales bacterium]|nr:Clp protease N-terminal domain-containing protein [Acidimicrobiales bacterium]
MTVTLSTLIEEVESRSPSPEPLDLLATASSTVEALNDTTDALLSHFVDRSRRAGHSWTEIGTALGVTKQAVQKRFTAERRTPRGFARFTDRARRVVSVHAPNIASALGNNYVGTEHILAGLLDEVDGLAARALAASGVTRQQVIAGIDARVQRGQQGRSGLTPRASVAIDNSVQVALDMGHNYVGTEHLLLSLMTGVGGMAEAILGERGVRVESLRSYITEALNGYSGGKKSS